MGTGPTFTQMVPSMKESFVMTLDTAKGVVSTLVEMFTKGTGVTIHGAAMEFTLTTMDIFTMELGGMMK
jgi:hypothetical protein